MRQLTRSKDQRMLGGVCGGLAEYLVVDPTVVRLGWVLLSLWGAGIVLYLVGLIIVPEEPSSEG